VRLDFHSESVVMSVVDNEVITTRLVSASDVALALLRDTPLSSGLLPPDTLWWACRQGAPEVGIWRRPKVWPVAILVDPRKPPHRFRLPMPGLIFVCQAGRPPRVYAAKRRPDKPATQVYHAPLYNLFASGSTCAGTHSFPTDPAEVPESFFASFFSPEASSENRSKRHPQNLMDLWREIDGARKYPMDDLMPFGTLRDIMDKT
jgi:hypothetical protein